MNRPAESFPRARLLLGIDTGGTYTDAVLLDDARRDDGPEAVVASAKSLTTHHDLASGIGEALDAVLAAGGVGGDALGLVSLSTTLATNAIVEGQGAPAALVMIGFDAADLGRQGLGEARGEDPLLAVAGGHDAHGQPRAPLDEAGLREALAGLPARVASVAICAHFAIRNPAHERRAREIVRETTGLPVTCSHELTEAVGGPRRALTALLNARLTPVIARLIDAAEAMLAARGIGAPLMVVRGDGALMSAEIARERPVETILSGPAASLVGATFLAGAPDAIVSDIGGTTTDVAMLRAGRPALDPAGAVVGGHRTFVEAVAMSTHGLGGDSEVHIDDRRRGLVLTLGPRRVIPLCRLAARHGPGVAAALERQLARRVPDALDGRFAIALGALPEDDPGAALHARLAAGPAALAELGLRGRDLVTLRRLSAEGRVGIAAFTPTDAAHVLGLHAAWDAAAARLGAELMARRRGADGEPVAPGADAFAEGVVEAVVRESARRLLDAAFAADGFADPDLSRHPLAEAALAGHDGAVRLSLTLGVPVVGLGAGAGLYYPRVGVRLGTSAVVPPHAGVANAVGAVAGHVGLTRRASVTVPAENRFRLHLPGGRAPIDHADAEAAIAAGRAAIAAIAREDALAAGAGDPAVEVTVERREATIEGRVMLAEAVLTATAVGRPRLARAPA